MPSGTSGAITSWIVPLLALAWTGLTDRKSVV